MLSETLSGMAKSEIEHKEWWGRRVLEYAHHAYWIHEFLKATGGGIVTALLSGLTDLIRHRPVDFWGLANPRHSRRNLDLVHIEIRRET
jgi:hypothetical protein